MKITRLLFLAVAIVLIAACEKDSKKSTTIPGDKIIDHRCIDLDAIPTEWISAAKTKLHIAYGHTSHGSQITSGMSGLVNFKGSLYSWSESGSNGALHLDDSAMPGDLGNPTMTQWATETRTYLNAHNNINVIMWSWCGQVSSASAENISTYLSLMSDLESDYPNVTFIYMTGHLDGSGLTGNLHLRNEQIRNYCKSNNKILFDFADIESYNPDGTYFGDKKPNDGCYYDSDANGSLDKNWAIDWQNSHAVNIDWFDCGAAHSESVNANMKAYAAWWLWARLAGWMGE
ncbi:MAG TPA: hypothetical protein VHO50_03745 [Bacteroidales bacterium]|nr:hypothetical protein [Bacteroidales bacterium]